MSLARRNILIADDEAYLTHILSYNLQKAGAVVRIERNGADLYAAAQSERPDLIITDYQMPGTDGFSACLLLKQNPLTATIPVIMLTGRGHRLAPSELIKTNIRCVFAKPFSARQLILQAEEILGATDEVANHNQTAAGIGAVTR